jgi:flagellar hook assembly protein FlgD
MDVLINIYSLSGKLIKVIKANLPSDGYVMPPVEWDGNDDEGKRVSRGIYPYIVSVKTEKGETSRVSGRMIIL